MEKKTNWGKEILSFGIMLITAVAIIFVFTRFVASPIRVNQSSMYPTLHDQDIGFSGRFQMYFGEIRRFDIVVIYMPSTNEYLVKRVIGLPGETISYKDDQLYIDDKIYSEDFLNDDYVDETIEKYGIFTEDLGPITLGNDEYYCLGDNRQNSKDSRAYGPIKYSQIRSVGIVIIYPFNHVGVPE